jgi:hypothetical protein
MTSLRKPSLRRLIAGLFLISGLSVQVQTLFACNLMDDGPKTTCCCGEHMADGCAMGGGCGSAPGSMATGCCDVGVELELQDIAVVKTTAAKLITQLDAPQPPPAILITTEFNITQPDNPVVPNHHVYRPSWPSGTRTYLVTGRFRV